MAAIFAWWGCSAAALIAFGLQVGFLATGQLLGLLIDSRGRYSLTHVQLSLWAVVILSLVAGVFFGRWQHNVDPLGFRIPSVVLALLGISVGSAVTVTAAKGSKNITKPANVAAAGPGPWRPSLMQIFLQEEGTYADQVVDITKFQNFVITVVLILAYIALAIHAVTVAGTAGKVTELPVFSGTFLILLGISHAAYLAGKLPSSSGQPAGLTVASSDVVAWAAARLAALSTGQSPHLRRRQLRQQRTKVTLWSDSAPVAEIPAGGSLVITDTRPFVLHWTSDNWLTPARDETAAPVGGGRYAALLTPPEFAGATEVQFTRRYQDRHVAAVPNGEWEATPASNHVVRVQAILEPR